MDQAICFHKFSLYQMYLCMYVCIRTRLFKKIPSVQFIYTICCYKHCFILCIETSNHVQQSDCVTVYLL